MLATLTRQAGFVYATADRARGSRARDLMSGEMALWPSQRPASVPGFRSFAYYGDVVDGSCSLVVRASSHNGENRPLLITRGTGVTVSFVYGPDGERSYFEQLERWGHNVSDVRLITYDYNGNLYNHF